MTIGFTGLGKQCAGLVPCRSNTVTLFARIMDEGYD